MSRKQLHIEKENWFSLIDDYTGCGACYAAE
jgi:hypothetical protein